MSKGKPPAPPDPSAVAGAQTAQNIGTAIAQQSLNNVNQVTPDGSLTYDQSGTQSWTDPNTGNVYEIPRYTATQQLSESGQAVKDQQNIADLNLSTLAADQSGRLGELLGTPVDLSNEATESRLMELGRSRLDPALDRRRESLRTSLSQQGIKEGSEAFDRAMARNSEGENDAYNQLLLSGRGQSVQEALANRNQPINEITALMSGSQVSQPNFVNPNTPNLANVDRAGIEMANYDQRQQNYRDRQGQLGGLFGLAARGIGGFF